MTASKLAHGTKLAALVITVAAGITIPQWFTCQDLRLFDREKMILFGIPSLISASVNIAVSAYISYKMVTKKTPEENTELRARYERDDDRVFLEVPTVSKAVQNQDDLFIEEPTGVCGNQDNIFAKFSTKTDRSDILFLQDGHVFMPTV